MSDDKAIPYESTNQPLPQHQILPSITAQVSLPDALMEGTALRPSDVPSVRTMRGVET